jgi:hypothetical protein
MSNGWTPERRARQAAMIQRWKPWTKSTGPRTIEGKARAARNGDRGGQWLIERNNLRDLRRTVGELLRQQRELLRRALE